MARPASAERPRSRPRPRPRSAPRRGKAVLEMTVEIGDGRSDVISVFKGDAPRHLAADFVRRNRLDASVVDPLTDHIQSHVDQLRQQRETPRAVSRERRRSRARTPRGSSTPRGGTKPSHATFKPAICPTSSVITRTMDDRKGVTAFDRLHQESKDRRVEARKRSEDCDVALAQRRAGSKMGMSQVSRALAENRGALNGAENYGDKLFQEGRLHAEQKAELLAEIRTQQQRRDEAEDLTFQPKINPSAKAKRSKVLDDYTGARKQLQREENERKRVEKEMRPCSFKPRIDGKSKDMAVRSKRKERLRRRQEEHDAGYDGVQTVHDELALDAEERERRMEAYQTSEYLFDHEGQRVTFKPKTNTSSRPRNDANEVDFVDRLVHSKRERDRQLDLVRARQNVDGDQTSRREPFRPKVPRAKSVPDVRRRPEKMSVHEHLYASREQFVDIKSTLAEREEQKRWTEANRCHTKKQSQQHIDARKRRHARTLFQQLSGVAPSRRRGSPAGKRAAQEIDTRELCLDGLEPALIKELVPALLAHEGDGTGVLDFETFYTILETIATDETSQVRAALHHRPLSEAEREARHRRQETAECTHEPQIDPVSRDIAEQLDGRGSGDIHARQMHQQHQQRDLARAQRAAMEADELRECTFQPRTNQSALSAWRAYRQEHRAEHRREEARAESAEGRSPMRPLSEHSSQEGTEELHVQDVEEDEDEPFDLAHSRDVLRKLAEKVRREDAASAEEGDDGEPSYMGTTIAKTMSGGRQPEYE